ncbi:hypothetical protein [Confluentibacter sediminis]|uniref:hypothetical protein n=1 Tax=Confluentibacter sediminis TaxID=2219045 RepID=UPI000DADA898|nr:hypothetical protein [Confluentibacter sediminis]
MKRIFEKWYIGLIVLPILINLITEYFNLSKLLQNWNFTIIGTLVIIIIILLYELNKAKKEVSSLKELPKKSDKEIIKELLKTLDINEFQSEIVEQSCWYGYRRSSINKLYEFCRKAELLKYKTADSTLNKHIGNLAISIHNFNDLASTILYGDNELTYDPDKKNPVEYEKAKRIYPKVDELSEKAFGVLTEMMKYLKTKNYLE